MASLRQAPMSHDRPYADAKCSGYQHPVELEPLLCRILPSANEIGQSVVASWADWNPSEMKEALFSGLVFVSAKVSRT
jgi:hypothetical protein